ncbi:MAG: tetraacyldisaccharide 4'-kinase [Candidatus Electrothrix aestuarii]|uniref:Tetraacyldisaccharide 4'-kinase n=1 Tax=Candidatus Electrothrix aestuarii TaxID=3062594 RepID=A0AAU8LV07_9BACT|nr:tetraacyldisaccharide 4'-kinase [Candidatus Electrothrix aestuarii]
MTRNFYYGLGRPFSPLYSAAMRLRESFYQKGTFKSTAFEVPVISVGNLTLGGTGKTPMVQYLARLLQQHGYQPAIISRGYGGATKERINIVSDGKEIFLDASYVGDEPRMLAETLPGVFVLTGIVRKLPAAEAVKMGADVLLLDDGFQHMAIRRDLDIVLFNTDKLAGNSRVFPGGDLREPINALQRCHAFVLTGTDEQNQERAEKFKELLNTKFPDKPVFFSRFQASGLVQQEADGKKTPVQPEKLATERCFAFCGIARPASFQHTLNKLNIAPVAFRGLPDHFSYAEKTVRQLRADAERTGATCFLCTEKDLVKLRNVDLKLPLYGIAMKAQPEKKLNNLILRHKSLKTTAEYT